METKAASRLTNPAAVSQRLYEDFDPVSKWRTEENRDVIEIHVPGFRREQIKIVVNHLGLLVISAERRLEGNRWKRFSKETEVPANCNLDAIHASFADNILSVVMPKKNVPPVSKKGQEDQIPELDDDDDHKENAREENENLKYKGRGTTEEETKHKHREGLEEEDHYHAAKYKSEEDHAVLTPEATSDVAFKFLIVVIVILIIASYVADLCKGLMAQAQSYL